jgi:SSS family solute:Na+ symporter
MYIWGLHVIDLSILIGFLIAILAVGVYVSRSVKHEADFYLGGRKMGKALQFFLNFGNATDSNGAVTAASEVYRQGAGGIWLGLQTLFITPFYWFTQVWFRRARCTTMADMWVDRFNSKSIAACYACFNIIVAMLQLGVGTRIGYELAASMIEKPVAEYNIQDQKRVSDFGEFQSLKIRYDAGQLPQIQFPTEYARYKELEDLQSRNRIGPTVSYVHEVGFYIAYSLVIAIYIMLGGLQAAAISDTIQGLLILVMSLILIPLGLHAVGGFAGLHAKVPEHYFMIFGSPLMSEYTWYTVLAITLGSFIQILGLSHNMAAAGSAKNEDTARFGMLSGGFSKRVIIIAWMFCGLLAVALLSGGKLSIPDRAWGTLSRELLAPYTGMFGVMLSGMLLGHMPSVGMTSVALSGLVTRNLYEPMFPGKTPKHYLVVGQLMIPVILGTSIIVAYKATGVIDLMQTFLTFNIFFGAVVVLTFFWRRLTVPAILISFTLWILVMGVAPLVGTFGFRHAGRLHVTTPEYQVDAPQPANAEDVAIGKAANVGQIIEKPYTVRSKPVFFDKLVRVDPAIPDLGLEGQGRFFADNYILYMLGMPFDKLRPSAVTACRWGFDALFPFFCLIFFSLITPRSAPERAPAFYARLKTPVGATPEEDADEVEKSNQHPDRFDHEKLLPGTNWEFTKWTKKDFIGFGACWGIVLFIVGILWAAVINWGAVVK